jgi:hypothetical protein
VWRNGDTAIYFGALGSRDNDRPLCQRVLLRFMAADYMCVDRRGVKKCCCMRRQAQYTLLLHYRPGATGTWNPETLNVRFRFIPQAQRVKRRQSKLSTSNKLLIYKAIFRPIWTYGIQLWGTASTSNIEIQTLFQSKALRMIVDATCLLHAEYGYPKRSPNTNS